MGSPAAKDRIVAGSGNQASLRIDVIDTGDVFRVAVSVLDGTIMPLAKSETAVIKKLDRSRLWETFLNSAELPGEKAKQLMTRFGDGRPEDADEELLEKWNAHAVIHEILGAVRREFTVLLSDRNVIAVHPTDLANMVAQNAIQRSEGSPGENGTPDRERCECGERDCEQCSPN